MWQGKETKILISVFQPSPHVVPIKKDRTAVISLLPQRSLGPAYIVRHQNRGGGVFLDIWEWNQKYDFYPICFDGLETPDWVGVTGKEETRWEISGDKWADWVTAPETRKSPKWKSGIKICFINNAKFPRDPEVKKTLLGVFPSQVGKNKLTNKLALLQISLWVCSNFY